MNFQFLFRHPLAKIVVVYWVCLTFWWTKIRFFGQEVGVENYVFNLSYIFFNIAGGVGGLIIANKRWGGFNSAVGRGLSFLALGLAGQGSGLLIWTYYNLILKIEVPYPSLADIGYFSLIPFYILATVNLAKAAGVKVEFHTLAGRIQIVLVPFLIFLISYVLFLQNVGIDLSSPVKTFLDVGYPAGEAISVSLALLTFSLSRKMLGGVMKKRIVFLIFALAFQYLTEFTFLYTSGLGIYYNASFVDLMYATSYFLMVLGIFSFSNVD